MDNTPKTTPALAIGIIILLIIIAGGIYFFAVPKAKAPTTTTSTSVQSNQTVVNYSCETGSIKATYTNASSTSTPSTVGLVLSDGRNFLLPQVASGSGIRYEQGAGTAYDIQFSSEGDNAFLVENGKTTYDNCVAGTSAASGTSTAGTKTFTDEGKTFSFSYPPSVTVSGGGVGYNTDWMMNATTSGMVLAKVTLPGSFAPKTNFADATLTVGTSADPTALAECLTYSDSGDGMQKSTVTINGVRYAKFVTNDAGAGNLYQTTSYRTIRNDQCYAVEYTIHSSQIANYPPSAGITAFDQSKVQSTLEDIVQSFTFL